jgi:hypothetical protein
MYTMNVEPLSSITPRTHSGGFENRHGDLGAAATVLADAPVVGCKSAGAVLGDIGRLRRIEPNPILRGRVKELL